MKLGSSNFKRCIVDLLPDRNTKREACFITLFLRSNSMLVRALAYRERVAKEILQTEKDYVSNMDALIKVSVNNMPKPGI